MATAGGLVFYGTMDGWFKAVDAKTGELKWQFKTGSGIIGQPVAYRGPDGHEYVAILSGLSPISKRKLGFTPELKEQRNQTMLFVFGL